jgi:hypothetical protein
MNASLKASQNNLIGTCIMTPFRQPRGNLPSSEIWRGTSSVNMGELQEGDERNPFSHVVPTHLFQS